MTVVAPTTDPPGAAILAEIAAVQATIAANPKVAAQYAQTLNALQEQAVDHFMATYWLYSGIVLNTMLGLQTVPVNLLVAYNAQVAAIATRTTKVAAIVAAGLPVITMGNEAPQYSVAYPLTQVPDTLLNQLQSGLVDWCMANSIFTAGMVLAACTGAQTYTFNYVSGYTVFSDAFA